jgi:hypothetical protein
MAAPKGFRPPNAGKGRVKGVPNKVTAQAKEAIEDAFTHLQQTRDKNLRKWAEENTDSFYTVLFPKLIPVQMQHQGHDGGKLIISWQTDTQDTPEGS